MRIAVTLVIDMTDQQVADYADHAGIPVQPTGHFRARDIAENVRGLAFAAVSGTFDGVGSGADISIKR